MDFNHSETWPVTLVTRLSYSFPIWYVMDRLLDKALSEQVTVTVCQCLGQHSSYGFPE